MGVWQPPLVDKSLVRGTLQVPVLEAKCLINAFVSLFRSGSNRISRRLGLLDAPTYPCCSVYLFEHPEVDILQSSIRLCHKEVD